MEEKKPQNAPAIQKAPTEPKSIRLQPSGKAPTPTATKMPTAKATAEKTAKTPVTTAIPTPKPLPKAAPAPEAPKVLKTQIQVVEQQVYPKSGIVFQPWQIAVAVVVVLALVAGAVFLGTMLGNQSGEDPIVDYTGGLNNGESADPNGITLPGYPTLTFLANHKKVALELPNPTGNPCYFRYTLTIVETGEEIYCSELLEPGKALQTITLNQALAAGTYTLRIEIDTYSLADGTTPMNGGVQEVILIVK